MTSIKLFPFQTSIHQKKQNVYTLSSLSLSLRQAMDSSEPKALRDHQNVVVIRHGDRMDNFEPLWLKTAKRPWDPPLVEDGRKRAFCKGRRIRTQLGFPIHRVFVSPFLRCVQTAFQVVSALCAVDDSPNAETSDDVSIDPSKVKASIEYGLCEILNNIAIRTGSPKDGEFGFNISELEAMLPAGTVDSTVERVYKELPQWGETLMDARARYVDTVQALADKYPTENLVLVTHGNGVRVAVSALKKETAVYKVEYCAYAELRRPIVHKEQSFTAGSFEVLTRNGQTGISFLPPTAAVDGVNGMHGVVNLQDNQTKASVLC